MFPAYAPTSTSLFTPLNNPRNPNTKFHEEITRLSFYKTPVHKAVCEALCEIYLIITTLEVVENAFLKDYVTDKEKYTSTVMRLINQYKTLAGVFGKLEEHSKALAELVPQVSSSRDNLVSAICRQFRLPAPAAADRLQLGIPTTITHMPKVEAEQGPQARLVVEATGRFITIMDALKLNYKTKEQLHPLLSDLVVGVNELGVDFDGKLGLVSWLIRLNKLEGELQPAESDDFLAALDTAYRGFYNLLE